MAQRADKGILFKTHIIRGMVAFECFGIFYFEKVFRTIKCRVVNRWLSDDTGLT